MAEKITLYIDSNHTSPYAMFAYLGLKEKGLPFETIQINIREKHHKVPEYQNLSVTGKIPTLVHGDFALAESSAILEYLEEVFPSPVFPRLLPHDIQHRARARQVQAWLRSTLLALRQERPTTVFFEPTQIDLPLSDEARTEAEKLIAVADSLISGNSGNLFGEWCIADTELALMLNRLVANGDEVPEKLKHYVHAQWARPSVQLWVARAHSQALRRVSLARRT